MERSQHARDVAQPRTLYGPFRHRTERLTLKIGNNEIFARVEKFSQVITAVNAYSLADNPFAEQRLEAAEDFALGLEQPLRFSSIGLFEVFQVDLHELERLVHQIAHGLVKRTLVQGRKGLRGKVQVSGIGS